MKRLAIYTAIVTISLFTFGCSGLTSENSEVEPNNFPGPGQAQVVTLPISGFTGSVSFPGDENDYFQVHLTAGEEVNVTMSFSNLNADLDVYLYDSTPQIVEGSETPSLTESFSYLVPVTGTYYINVYAYDGNSSYTLVVTVS